MTRALQDLAFSEYLLWISTTVTHTCWCYDVFFLLHDVFYDVFFTLWLTFWLYVLLLHVMMYFPYCFTSWRTLHIFCSRCIFLDVNTYFMVLWLTFWWHGIHLDVMTYFLAPPAEWQQSFSNAEFSVVLCPASFVRRQLFS